MAFTTGAQGSMMSDINVTPFVDVMLVLLIIFMVTAPLMATGLDVNLPKASAPTMEMKDDQLVLTIDKEGRYFINKNEFTVEELKLKLPAIAKANPEQDVFLKADGSIPYEKVAQLMSICTRAGIARMGMVTQLETER
jgi:biopolymer transport protein TolR